MRLQPPLLQPPLLWHPFGFPVPQLPQPISFSVGLLMNNSKFRGVVSQPTNFIFNPSIFLGTSRGLVSASVVSLTCTAVQVAASWLQAFLQAGLCEATDGVGGGRQAGHKLIVPFLC
jgi:hypothetical protein